MTQAKTATLEDLLRTDGKAELVDGRIERMSPTGFLPNFAAMKITMSLAVYAERTRSGYAITDGAGFVINLPKRETVSPDAAFYTGTNTGMGFLEGAPVFAVEVRSQGDYGARAEKKIRLKRLDYFAAGTAVVWDVDLQSSDVVRSYASSDPERPTIYRRGDHASAEPAVPGWGIAVEELFPYMTRPA